jgi:hypothetical protein
MASLSRNIVRVRESKKYIEGHAATPSTRYLGNATGIATPHRKTFAEEWPMKAQRYTLSDGRRRSQKRRRISPERSGERPSLLVRVAIVVLNRDELQRGRT